MGHANAQLHLIVSAHRRSSHAARVACDVCRHMNPAPSRSNAGGIVATKRVEGISPIGRYTPPLHKGRINIT